MTATRRARGRDPDPGTHTRELAPPELGPPRVRPARLRPWHLALGGAAVVAVAVAGVVLGPVRLPPAAVVGELLDRLPLLSVDSGLTATQEAIVWELRLPRVALGLLVGAMLGMAGASYQGVFRNPLADPYLLGAAAGAGLGATVAIAAGATLGRAGAFDLIPLAAFAGALGAVGLTYALGAAGGRRSGPAVLILAGVAVAAFLTAVQTFVLQREVESIRQVYSWILGRLVVAGWGEVVGLLPYVAVASVVLLAHRRALDVLAVGDDEAATLGLEPRRVRLVVVAAASLGTAAAVAMSGLIGFVGIIVPHTVRLLVGSSHRVLLPLSALFGAAFLAGADLLARVATAPVEIPIGVVTALFGAPFFVVVLRTSRRTFG